MIVFRFAESGFPWHTYITLSIGYFVAFGIIMLVPIDIATVVFDRKSTFTEAQGDPRKPQGIMRQLQRLST